MPGSRRGAPSGYSSSSSSSSSPPDWRKDVLRLLGAPATPANLAFLSVWQKHEGGWTNNSADFNPLNTTSGASYPAINSVGVRKYPDYATGMNATAATIANGRYPAIVRGLKAGNPYNPTLREGILGDLSTWVSGSRTGGLSYGASILGSPQVQSAGIGGGLAGFVWDESKREWRWVGQGAAAGGHLLGGVPVIGDTLKGIAGFGAAGGPLGVVGSAGDAIKWAWQNWDRIAEVVGGFLLVLIGLVLMGRSLGVTKTKVEVVQRALPGGESRALEDAAAAAEERAYVREAAKAGRARARGETSVPSSGKTVPAPGFEPRARSSRSSSSQTDEIPF